MTNNQIAFARLQEEKRSHLATEGETKRHNVYSEDLEGRKVEETQRHNIATESNDLFKNSETMRHNVVAERETSRHNIATEGLDSRKLSETIRHNVYGEGLDTAALEEGHRHNVAQEGIGRAQAGAAQTNAAAAASQARTAATREAHDYAVAQDQLIINEKNADTNRANAWWNEIKAKSQQELVPSQQFSNYVGSIASGLGGIGRVAALFTGG